MSRLKATGRIGSWFANVKGQEFPEGTDFPVIHDFWIKIEKGTMNYHDKKLSPEHPKANKFTEAIKNDGRVILQKSRVVETREDETKLFEREKYIALFEIDRKSVIHDDKGLRFTITSRLANLT